MLHAICRMSIKFIEHKVVPEILINKVRKAPPKVIMLVRV